MLFNFKIMKLVKLENYELKIEDELLLLKPFRVMWNADRTANKTHFFDFLSLIYSVYEKPYLVPAILRCLYLVPH